MGKGEGWGEWDFGAVGLVEVEGEGDDGVDDSWFDGVVLGEEVIDAAVERGGVDAEEEVGEIWVAGEDSGEFHDFSVAGRV